MKKITIKKALAFPFKILATAFGVATMIFAFIVAMINGLSFNEFCEKIDSIINSLESLNKQRRE